MSLQPPPNLPQALKARFTGLLAGMSVPGWLDGRLPALFCGIGGGVMAIMVGLWLTGGLKTPDRPTLSAQLSQQLQQAGLQAAGNAHPAYPNQPFTTQPAQRNVVFSTSDNVKFGTGPVFSGLSKADLLSATTPNADEGKLHYQNRLKQELAQKGYSWSPEGVLGAARGGDVPALTRYQRAGFDLNSKNTFGSTPLFAAAEANQLEAVKLLLAANVDLNTLNARGLTALHRAAEQNLPAMVALLLAAGANPNLTTQDGWTPLFYAVQSNNLTMLSQFVQAGNSVNLADKFGTTPLLLAVRKGFPAITKQLLQLGANANAADVTGLTPLHIAAQGGQYQIASMLLAAGGRPDLKSLNGSTPMDIALATNNLQLANLLLAHGAKRPHVMGGQVDTTKLH